MTLLYIVALTAAAVLIGLALFLLKQLLTKEPLFFSREIEAVLIALCLITALGLLTFLWKLFNS